MLQLRPRPFSSFGCLHEEYPMSHASWGSTTSILRELSGVYKPFVKAFKELISTPLTLTLTPARYLRPTTSRPSRRDSVVDDALRVFATTHPGSAEAADGGPRERRERGVHVSEAKAHRLYLALARYSPIIGVRSSAIGPSRPQFHLMRLQEASMSGHR